MVFCAYTYPKKLRPPKKGPCNVIVVLENGIESSSKGDLYTHCHVGNKEKSQYTTVHLRWEKRLRRLRFLLRRSEA